MVETYFNALPSLLLTIILLEDLFFFLVLRPRAGLPQGVHGPGPVSYTHLDVYKRQLDTLALIRFRSSLISDFRCVLADLLFIDT